MATSTHSGTTNFTYNNSARKLTQEQSTRLGGYTYNYTHDLSGSPTQFRSSATNSYNADDQPSTVTHDGNGSPATASGLAITYDRNNKPTQFGTAASASYRADGLRGWKQVGSAKTYYIYDNGVPILELDATGAIKAVNVYSPEGLIALKQDNAWRYYQFDFQGNIAQTLNASGVPIDSRAYNAYGVENRVVTSGMTVPADPFGFNARWGYTLDRETGFYYCQNRYYNPSEGRWLTRDPIGYAGGMNVYGYLNSQPVGSYDAD